jgi:hypothetical protein
MNRSSLLTCFFSCDEAFPPGTNLSGLVIGLRPDVVLSILTGMALKAQIPCGSFWEFGEIRLCSFMREPQDTNSYTTSYNRQLSGTYLWSSKPSSLTVSISPCLKTYALSLGTSTPPQDPSQFCICKRPAFEKTCARSNLSTHTQE